MKKIKINLRMKTYNSFYKRRKTNQNLPNLGLESDNFIKNSNLQKMEEEYTAVTSGLKSRSIKTAQSSKNKLVSSINNYSEEKKKDIKDKWKTYENLTPEQIRRKEFLESKKKWISKEDFHRHFGLRTTSIKPIANIMNYGEPVSSHKYRDINPSKWITPNGFI